MAGDALYFPNVTSVRELLAGFYGNPFITKPKDTDYTVGTTAIKLGNGVFQVVNLLVQNIGTTNITVSYSPNVTTTTGFLLGAKDAFRSDWYYDGDLLMRPLYAISDGAGGLLHMVERCLDGV